MAFPAPNVRSSSSLTVSLQSPLWFSGHYSAEYQFANQVEDYSHEIAVDGGFKTMSLSLKVGIMEIGDWLEFGLGRHVVVQSPTGQVVWVGAVNLLTIQIGGLTVVRGPLLDIANRVSVMYTPILDPDVLPPVTGIQTETPINQDQDSIDRYSILEKVVAGGQLLDDGTTDEAEEIRDLILAEFKDPFIDETMNIGSASEPKMTIACVGYHEWFAKYVYNNLNPLTTTFHDKIQDVITADPNGIFSSDFSQIGSNLLLTSDYEDQNRFANTIIQEITVQGGASDERWTFGVYEDQVCYYQAIPTTVRYRHMLSETAQYIVGRGEQAIDPWDVRPGEWVEVTDFAIGGEAAVQPITSTRGNPRVMFIENVRFTAPNSLTMSGSRVGKVNQRLAQLGLGGIS